MAKKYYCNFCGKDGDNVDKLIAGPDNIFICNECVSLCNDIIDAPKLGNAEYDSWGSDVQSAR